MNGDLIFGPATEIEIAEARDWYDQRSPGLGADFVAAVEVALRAIQQNPFQYQIVWGRYRRVRLGRFPFNLLYSASGQQIRVVACIRNRQNPKAWRQRR